MGFDPPTNHIIALKLEVEGATEGVQLTIDGNTQKTVGAESFDGDSDNGKYIYLALDANTQKYTFTANPTGDGEETVSSLDLSQVKLAE